MKANLSNIQKIYLDYPNTWVVDGVRIDNYKKSDNHFLHGWRDVVIPELEPFQKLGLEYILVDDIVTKEVIDFTSDEINNERIQKAIAIDLDYTSKISRLLRKHLEKFYCDYTPIPDNIMEQRNQLREECNAKILDLGITDFTYRKTIKGL